MPLSPGHRLGPYEIVAPIGAGGMGEVYKAIDTRLGRTVAIKTLDSAHDDRFRQEARAVAALNHPHICVLYDVGPGYLVMEYIDGQPLHGPLPLAEVVRVATQVADALEAAHARGILHRDLKPANIMMTTSGAKLLDFGLAKILAEASDDATRTMAGTVMGTASYMSPEQAQGKAIDARSDVFSFGAVLYELLTGRRVFERESLLDTLNAVVREDPRPLDSPASSIVMRCLAKQQENRFQTIAEVRAALELLRSTPAGAIQAIPSIAVLPFANMSHNADDEYFSDGLAEEIINALVQVPGLKVIARTSAFAFKGKNEDIRKIAETLGVTNVLEGSVRRAGSRIRVTAQLILARDGTHLWSQRYDRELADIFAVQDEIAAAIADALKLKLSPPSERRMPSIPAYEAYLKYRFHQWRFTPEDSQRSRECLEQALSLDPGFALPYVGLADYHLALAAVGAMPSLEAMPRARELAMRALEIDPDLPEAHAMLGIVASVLDFDWHELERRIQVATAREPLSPHLRQWKAYFFLFSIGRPDEAAQHVARIIDDDPLCQMWHYTQALTLAALGREDEALDAIRRAVELDSQFWIGWMLQSLLHSVQGRHAESLHCAEKAIAAAPWAPIANGAMAAALVNTGRPADAEPMLDGLRSNASSGPLGMAYYSLARGDMDGAVEWAGAAADQRVASLVTIVIRPFEPRLRTSHGWPALLKKLNLTPAMN
jgi:eukaryotic-like serine/threonine-protein kinase